MHVSTKDLRSYLKELLDDIISKDINHELVGRLEYLIENQLTFCRTCPLKFQLDKPAHNPIGFGHVIYYSNYYSHQVLTSVICEL